MLKRTWAIWKDGESCGVEIGCNPNTPVEWRQCMINFVTKGYKLIYIGWR